MNKRKTSLKILIILLVIFATMVAAFGFILVMVKQDLTASQNKIADLELEIESNSLLVYVATDDLSKGTVLQKDVNVELQENVTALPSEFYITEKDMGKTLLVDISAYEPVMTSMVTSEDITNDTREYEIGVANLMVDQKINDYVDIRVMFPNGEDYIVISKLKINKLLLEDSIFYANLNESEILTLASVTIDAYTISGTKIYLTRYVESNLQEEATPNYPVRNDIISLMASDPNILEVAQETLNYNARQVMEKKLSSLSGNILESVTNGHQLTDTAHNSALVNEQATNGNVMTEGINE